MSIENRLSKLLSTLTKRRTITPEEGFAICVAHAMYKHDIKTLDGNNFDRLGFMKNDRRLGVKIARLEALYHPEFFERICHWYADYILPYLKGSLVFHF